MSSNGGHAKTPKSALSPVHGGNGRGNESEKPLVGAALVVGGGVAGIQASLDLSAAGFRVYVVEESPTVGGQMARLDKTFPTGDCATCIISPKLVEFTRDYNIDVYTMTDIVKIEGEAGNFRVQARQRPRSVDIGKCKGCGECWNACPVRNIPAQTSPFAPEVTLTPEETAWIEETLAGYHDDPAPLLQILQEINEHRGYLPPAMLQHLSARLQTPLAEIYRVASFYNAFSLEPVGRHLVEVCLGTACFVRGSGLVLERLEEEIGIQQGQTDNDERFTLRTVRCIGCCALAPAMRVNGITFGKMKLDKIPSILERFE